MTLILALPATDGVALVTDTRKWFRVGGYVDGHHKLVSSRDGLVTGAGSGQLLDDVAKQARHGVFPEVVDLIEQVAQRGLWDGELADWILTAESRSACRATAEHGVGIAMYDGFSFKRIGWGAGIVPTGLPPDFRARAKTQVRPVFDESLALNEVLSVAFDVCSDLYPSGLVSQDFDFGTHRPGHQLSIERLRVPGRRRSPKSASFSV